MQPKTTLAKGFSRSFVLAILKLRPICSFQMNILFSDLEWKIIYVGSAESEEYDQTLDTVVVGPIIAGRHMFVFEVIVGIICMCF